MGANLTKIICGISVILLFLVVITGCSSLGQVQTREINMNWEISSRWKVDAAHLFDLKEDHVVENLFGVKYESCCWGLRLSTKERYLSETTTDRGIYLELILKGLGGFGIQQ